MADLRELKDRAADHLRKGRFAKAAEVLREIVRAEPRDLATRQKLADALRRSGEPAEALRTYRDVAGAYASGGELIKAIAVCKLILDIDPNHEATQAALADLYTRRRAAPAARSHAAAYAAPQAVFEREPSLKPVSGSGTTGVPLELEMVGGTGSIPLELDRRDRSSAGFTPPPILPQGDDPFAGFVAPQPVQQISAEELAAADPAAAAVPPTPFEEMVHAARDAEPSEPAVGIVIEADELPEGDEPLEPLDEAGGPAVAAAAEAGSAAAELPTQVLPEIPLFSDLSRDAFVQLARELVRREVASGEPVVRQGDKGDAFFVVASGQLHVERRDGGASVVLARLGEGEFFGEMALLSGEPRMASVVADTPSEVLEVSASALTALCRAHPHVAESLTRFYRRRLLANAMMTSPVFRPFARADRANLARRFRTREVATGEVLVREGAASDGMYVALSGRYQVRRGAGAGAQLVATLREGDVFGEISCLRKQPASASVVAARPGIVLRLPRADFDAVAMAHPQVLELVAGLADERAPDPTPDAKRPGQAGPFLV